MAKRRTNTPEEIFKFDLPKGYLSPTQIGCYQRCPQQYEFRYVQGWKSPPGVALVEGSSHHEALAVNNTSLKLEGKFLPFGDVFDCFANAFEMGKKDIEDWGGEDSNLVMTRAKPIVERCLSFHQDRMEKTKDGLKHAVVEVEERVEVIIGGVKVVGVVDVVASLGDEKGKYQYGIYDYKCSNRKWSDVAHSVQLVTYSMAFPEACGRVGVIQIERKPKGKINLVSGRVTAVDRALTESTVTRVAMSITAGSFPPCDSGNWWCSEKWCGYWHKCRGAKTVRGMATR